ncbi:hypothetical protein AVEN_34649-1 [Araneus ventricosus]|uniref:Uncharacterized protein n=1 Tax=Araneus ventricosus TaxID=182803 RepID=A0A4Y2B0F2_ARAVE|nr:hypothetical protein AVEN_34649-1 [Araneus ventricosus]
MSFTILLVPKENIYLPPLYIKLGLIKQFVKAMDKTGDGFNFLKTKFPRLSEAKIEEGIFVSPQIRQLFNDSTFMKSLSRKGKRAWLAFKNVCVNFLGNKNSDYVAHVEELLSAYKPMRWNMSLKVHFLHSQRCTVNLPNFLVRASGPLPPHPLLAKVLAIYFYYLGCLGEKKGAGSWNM